MNSLWRRLAAGGALAFIVALALILIGDLRQVVDHLARFPWSLAPLILLCTLFNYSLRFLKWHYYVRLIGARSLGWKESARVFVGGFPLSITPGKVGEAIKGVWLQRAAGTPVSRGIMVVLAERISDGLAVLLLSTLGVVAFPRYWPVFLIALSLLLLAVVISQIRPLADRIVEFVTHLPILRRFSKSVGEFYLAAHTLFRPRATAAAVGLGMIAWLGEGVGLYLVLRGLDVPAGRATLGAAIFALSFSTVIGALSALPGGLGAADASIAALLILSLGMAAPTAAAATLLIRLATLWFGALLGLAVWLFSPDLPFATDGAPTGRGTSAEPEPTA
jgi:uncharacterized protein (TIRG00374 family)